MSCVLIVDDEAMNRDLLRKVLGKEGFEVAEAADGGEALVQMGRREIALVLLDLMMPVMDGFETIREIRRQECGVPIIVMSALNDPASLERAVSLGADAYIVKPFDLPLLVGRVREVLNGVSAEEGR